ncbi:sensor histidine kinase [Solibacillus sp. R5-41]|uniref:sensor histidine kinase n=1 Tax=Solibacillus sp. R5-41 TaxID=2048654 RepID=UPI000C125B4B|nr:sensor histidine kinase [Solibacillus sp. R5-41]ATP41757.1 sensor histidine kinase [Solibacillus sp. R5-41]
MAIKLFLKEHSSYVLFQLFMTVFLISLFWLEGFRSKETAIYAIAINMLLVTSFLIVRYMLRRRYLAKITQFPTTVEDALQKNAKTAEYALTERYLHELYKLYQHEVQSLYATQSRQYKFMNQWVHQMKTPVSVLELLLQQDEELDNKSVQEEVDRLKRGLEMVLINARLENFEEDMQIVQVPLKSIVTTTINENKRLFIANRVFPNVDVDEDLYVMSDSKWLRFLIDQFITNAVKYTFEPNKKIYISSTESDHQIILTIQDEGIGIPKSDLSRVTKAFYTGENGRKTGESTGMGLYIAKEICDKLGHQLVITSEVDQGTKIEVVFNS